MATIIYWIGLVVTILLALYIVLFILYKVFNPNKSTVISTDAMPTLRPVPIPTKKQKTPVHKLVVAVFDVRKWELDENWHFQLNEEDELIIPKGFIFDGASIPRPLWGVLSPVGLLLIPGLLHDYGYKYDQLWRIGADGHLEPFKKSAGKDHWDQLFKDVGDNVNGVFLVNMLAQIAVAIGGKSIWKKHRERNLVADKPVIE